MPSKLTENLLSEAEAIELDRYKIYKEKVNQMVNPDKRQLIKFLMQAEKRHLNLIREQKRFPLQKIDARLTDKMKIFRISKTLKKETSHGIGDINILKMAEKIEAEDCPFYGRLIKEIDDKNVKSLFTELQKQECLHLGLIRKKLKEMQQLSVAISKSQNPRFNPRSI